VRWIEEHQLALLGLLAGTCVFLVVVLVVFFGRLEGQVDEVDKQQNAQQVVDRQLARLARRLASDDIRAAKESIQRQHQTCLLHEHDHRVDVRRLRTTYKFILNPPPGAGSLLPLALAGVRAAEEDARDRAPSYCDRKVMLPLGFDKIKGTRDDNYVFPGRDGRLGTADDGYIGLEEPDPRTPRRPAEVDRILRGGR
jgi:hypothetical protein